MPEDLCNDGPIQEVEDLRRRYRRARRRYRAHTARAPPRLRVLQRLAMNLYTKQTEHLQQYATLLYQDGILPRLVRPIERRTLDRIVAAPYCAAEECGPRLRRAVNDLAAYACFDALMKAPIQVLDALGGTHYDACTFPEARAMRIVEELRTPNP